MRKFITTIVMFIAVWVSVECQSVLCKKAWVYVERPHVCWRLALASIEYYDWGFYWKVYKESEVDDFHGVSATKEAAEKEVYNILLGSRFL